LYGIDHALVNSPYAHGNLFSRLHMGSNMTQIQALVSPTISLIIRVGERKFRTIFALGSESSRERKFHGTAGTICQWVI